MNATTPEDKHIFKLRGKRALERHWAIVENPGHPFHWAAVQSWLDRAYGKPVPTFDDKQAVGVVTVRWLDSTDAEPAAPKLIDGTSWRE